MAKKRKKIRKLSIKPRSQTPDALRQALSLHQAGNFAAAGDIYRNLLKRTPKNGDALNLAGVLALQNGELPKALTLLQKAVKYYPDRPAYSVNLGAAFRAKGELSQAITAFKKALQQTPNHQEALYNLASVLAEQGCLNEAITYYRRLLGHNPKHQEALTGITRSLYLQGELPEALQQCSHLLEISPPTSQSLVLKGQILHAMGNYESSLHSLREALSLAPDDAAIMNNMANALVKMGRLQRAMELYQKAVLQNPDLGNAYINLAWIYREYGMLSEAWQCFQTMRRHLSLSPQDHSDLLFSLNYDPAFNNQKMYEEACNWWTQHNSGETPLSATPAKSGAIIKVGFISPDFFKHPVGKFIHPLLQGFAPDRIESFCYASLQRPADELTLKLQKAANHWRDISPLNDQDAANLIVKDKIDILFDLAGHTAHNRLGVMSRKPAPVQASWLGYVNTTGLPVIDYRLTDEIADPPGSEVFYSENLYRLPHGFFCFIPPAESPEIAPLPSAQSGNITFGSFNNLPKITPEVVEVWAAILSSLPKARLFMVSRQFAEPAIIERYKKLFAQYNCDKQIVFHGGLPYLEYLKLFNRVDIALDPFPHNGHTITCDTLWMGVPVITLRGDCYAGRMGSSIMTRISLNDLIAESKEEYIKLSLDLADNKKRLRELRQNMRQRISATICDNKQFCKDFEQAVEIMVEVT